MAAGGPGVRGRAGGRGAPPRARVDLLGAAGGGGAAARGGGDARAGVRGARRGPRGGDRGERELRDQPAERGSPRRERALPDRPSPLRPPLRVEQPRPVDGAGGGESGELRAAPRGLRALAAPGAAAPGALGAELSGGEGAALLHDGVRVGEHGDAEDRQARGAGGPLPGRQADGAADRVGAPLRARVRGVLAAADLRRALRPGGGVRSGRAGAGLRGHGGGGAADP